MPRTPLAPAWMVLLVVAGCAESNPFRARRDEALLHDRQAVTAASFHVPPPTVATSFAMPLDQAGAALFRDPRQNRDGALTLRDAIALALQNSQIVRVASGGSIAVETNTALDIDVADARVQAALAAFDTNFVTELYGSRLKQPPNSFFGPGLANPTSRDEAAFKTGFSKRSTLGGQASLLYNPDPGYLFIPGQNGTTLNPRHVGELELQIRQPLLRGAWWEVNQAPILIGQITTQQSAWEFKTAVMAAVRSVVEEYWSLYSTRAAVESLDEVIPLLEEVARLQQQAYESKWVIYADVAKARAQLHDFRQRRLELLSDVVASELRLRHLLGLPPADGWNLVPSSSPTDVAPTTDPQAALEAALAHHPDLVRQRLNVRLRELELQLAENESLPQLDLQALYRLNGIGEDVGEALGQMFTAEYSDWLLGATLTAPLGRRAGSAGIRAAELQLAREHGLLQQTTLSVVHDLGQHLQQIEFAFEAYEQSRLRLQESDEWVRGARLRYENPDVGSEDRNWLLQSLNDYLAALRFRTEAAADRAAVLARYNSSLIRLQESQGTLLDSLAIELLRDPCRQSARLPNCSVPPEPLGLPRVDHPGGPFERLP